MAEVDEDNDVREGWLRILLTRVLWPSEVTLQSYTIHRRYYWALIAFASALATGFTYQWFGWWSLLSFIAVPILYRLVEVLVLNPPWLGTCRVKSSSSLTVSFVVFLLADATVRSTEYYKFAGSVVPVLLLAIILERRQEYWSIDSFGERFLTFMNIIGLVIAGTVIMRVLAEDNAGKGDARLVITPIVFTIASLLMSLVARPDRASRQEGSAAT